MSNYENYHRASSVYDDHRIPFGLLDLKRALACHSLNYESLGQMHVLDAACGTGNHSVHLAKMGVGKITMVDGNRGMLDVAAEKLRPFMKDDRITLKQQVLPDLPFDDNTFDFVMCNMAIHHIEDGKTAGFPVYKRLLESFSRVLKPGGMVFVTCDATDNQDGVWWLKLLGRYYTGPNEVRIVPFSVHRQFLQEVGFEQIHGTRIIGEVWGNEDLYGDFNSIFSKEFRDANSGFALAGEKGVKETLAKAEAMTEEERLKYMQKTEEFRWHYGVSKVVTAVKPGRAVENGY